MPRVVVAAPPVVLGPGDLAGLPPAADLIELRLDLLPGPWDEDRLVRWIGAAPRPVLATVRSRRQGGAFAGPPAEAARLLAAAARSGARWVDAEAEVLPHLGQADAVPPTVLPPGVSVLLSHHGEDALARALPEAEGAPPPQAVKRAPRVDGAAALAALRAYPVPAATSVVPYGRLGAVRAAWATDASFLFGAASDAGRVAAGQPTLLALLDELRAGEVTPRARLYGLLGEPPSRSPSPALHNAAFRYLGLDALYVPLPDLRPEEATTLPFHGFSVTTPFKGEALAVASGATSDARRIGAANTLVRDEDGRWVASNTDADAVAAAVEAAPAGGEAFVYGAGGFARAAVQALGARGYAVRLGARDAARGRSVAAALGVAWAGPAFVRRPGDRVLVNATPLGAHGEGSAPLTEAPLDGLRVLDAPYGAPGEPTALVQAATGRAGGVVDGRTLLRLQAQGQVRRFTGRAVPDVVLDLALWPPPPLLLMGLRGAGKTTVGRLVALRLGRPFLDLDDEVTRISGRTPAAWLVAEGEAALRAVEAAAVARLAGRRGVVVAAGGGVLESAAAREGVERATCPVWLDAPPHVTAARVRASGLVRPPLGGAATPEEEARVAHARRAPAWRAVARHVVDAARPADAVADDVIAAWAAAIAEAGGSRGSP